MTTIGIGISPCFGLAAGGGDATAPALVSAAIDTAGTTLTLTYDEALDDTSEPATTDYALTGTASTVNAVNVTGSTVVLTLTPAVFVDEAVTLDYTAAAAPVQDLAGNDAANLTDEPVTNGSTVLETPLGDATWLLYWDARDHDWEHDQVLSAAFDPRIGSGQLTPANSPTVVANGIGGRTAVSFGDATNARFDGHWLAALFGDVDQPCSGFARIRRTGNEAGIAFGFGRASATDQFLEVGHSAAGAALVRKDGASEATISHTSATNLGFVDRTIGFSTDGATVTLYVDGAVTSIDDAAMNTTTSDWTQFRIATTGRDTAGTDDLAGLVQVVGVTDEVLTDQNHADIHSFLAALDLPASPGTPIMFLGDSLTLASSYREPMFDHIEAEEYGIDMQGPLQSGSFSDNQHAGYSGRTIAQISSIATNNLGTGNPYDAVELVIVMAGTNDTVGGYDGATAAAAYRSMLEAIHTAITSAVATARICVTTIPPKDGANNAFVTDFNSRLDAEWDDFDSDHGSNLLIRADAHTAIGGVYNASLYLDAAHPNAAGNLLIMTHASAGIIQAVDAYLASIAA